MNLKDTGERKIDQMARKKCVIRSPLLGLGDTPVLSLRQERGPGLRSCLSAGLWVVMNGNISGMSATLQAALLMD